MKTLFQSVLLLLLFTTTLRGQEKTYPGSYYITFNNDTIHTTLIYTDLFIIQHSIESMDSNGVKTRLYPNTIKGFCLAVSPGREGLDYYCDDLSPEWLSQTGESSTFSSMSCFAGSIDSLSAGKFYSDLYYETVFVKDAYYFIHRLYGKSSSLKLFSYYYPAYNRRRLYRSTECYSFITRDDAVVTAKGKFSKQLASLTSDYTLLSNMIRSKELFANTPRMNASFPYIERIFGEYERWKRAGSQNPMDTSLVLRGIIEANRYYKPHEVYYKTALVSSAFVIPGIIYGMLVFNHEPTFKELNIPANCSYCRNTDYLDGYATRAMYLKARAIKRGVLTGAFISLFVVLPLIVITGS